MTALTDPEAHTPAHILAQPGQSEDGLPDFSVKRTNVRFRVDGDVFEAPRAIPADTMADIVNRFSDIDDKGKSEAESIGDLREIIRVLLFPESVERFLARMGDQQNPIGTDQVGAIIPWLMEQYGMRPTEPLSSSSDTGPSPETGTGSTAPALAVASGSENSPPTSS